MGGTQHADQILNNLGLSPIDTTGLMNQLSPSQHQALTRLGGQALSMSTSQLQSAFSNLVSGTPVVDYQGPLGFESKSINAGLGDNGAKIERTTFKSFIFYKDLENKMRTHSTHSACAGMRMLRMARVVQRSIDAKQMRLINDIAIAQDDILRIVEEYEIDLAKAGDSGPFFNADRSLHQALVTGALDEIEGESIQLQVSQTMHGLFRISGSPKKERVLFVENAVEYWGIGESWSNWLLNKPVEAVS